MLQLERLQRRLRGGIAGAVPAEARLQIYRNHYTITLTDALAATYPVVHRLVGEGFFNQAARRFVRMAPPASPCLFDYGAGFGDFLATLREAAALPYLADVARFEWALNLAYQAEDDGAARTTLRSAFPVSQIWLANQPDADPALVVDLADGGETLFVWRDGLDVVWRRIDQETATEEHSS